MATSNPSLIVSAHCSTLFALTLTAVLFAGCSTRPKSRFAGLSPQQARVLAEELAARRD